MAKPSDIFHIAIDLGASNGRVFLGRFAAGKPQLVEAHRFTNGPILQDGRWRWNWEYLCSEIHAGLYKAAELAGRDRIVSLGCSSWAQDFVLLDNEGRPLENPVCYRDEFTRGLPHAFANIISPADLVKRVGGSVSPITTLCKLKAIRNQSPQLLQKAKTMLHMADMVHFDLCGRAITDWTLATAGQLFNILNQDWDYDLLAQLDIPAHILPPVIMRPRVIGRIKAESSPHPKLNDVSIVSTAHHDTACATACFRPLEPGSLFICLGSYAMPGCVLSSAQRPAGADPEKNALIGIADRQWGLFGPCAGLWIIQECRRIWQERGVLIEYDRLMHLVDDSNYQGIIDLTSPRFAKPTDMLAEIHAVCRENGLAELKAPGDIAKLVFDSLAAGFEQIVRIFQEAGKMSCSTLHVAGGGVRNKYLIRQIADRTGCKVIVGPAEATAVGNLMLQQEVMQN